MTRDTAKNLTLTNEALKQRMVEQAEGYTSAVTNKMLGDLFTFSKERLRACYEAGFRAGAAAVKEAWESGGMRPQAPTPKGGIPPGIDLDDIHQMLRRGVENGSIAEHMGPTGPMGERGERGQPGQPGPPGQPAAEFEIG